MVDRLKLWVLTPTSPTRLQASPIIFHSLQSTSTSITEVDVRLESIEISLQFSPPQTHLTSAYQSVATPLTTESGFQSVLMIFAYAIAASTVYSYNWLPLICNR